MKHIWSVLCKSSSIDQQTSLITLRDCIEQLNITIFKNNQEAKRVFPIEFELVHLWSGDQSDETKKFEVKVELRDPKNKKINEFLGFFVYPENKKRMRILMKVKGLPATSMGRYIFRVKLKEGGQKQYREVAEIPLDITFEYK